MFPFVRVTVLAHNYVSSVRVTVLFYHSTISLTSPLSLFLSLLCSRRGEPRVPHAHDLGPRGLVPVEGRVVLGGVCVRAPLGAHVAQRLSRAPLVVERRLVDRSRRRSDGDAGNASSPTLPRRREDERRELARSRWRRREPAGDDGEVVLGLGQRDRAPLGKLLLLLVLMECFLLVVVSRVGFSSTDLLN